MPHDDRHPLETLLDETEKRIKRLAGIAKGFDGEQARRELSLSVYPIMQQLINFCGDMDSRIEGEDGLDPDVAVEIISALQTAAVVCGLALKHVPEGPDRVQILGFAALLEGQGARYVEALQEAAGIDESDAETERNDFDGGERVLTAVPPE